MVWNPYSEAESNHLPERDVFLIDGVSRKIHGCYSGVPRMDVTQVYHCGACRSSLTSTESLTYLSWDDFQAP